MFVLSFLLLLHLCISFIIVKKIINERGRKERKKEEERVRNGKKRREGEKEKRGYFTLIFVLLCFFNFKHRRFLKTHFIRCSEDSYEGFKMLSTE